MIIHIDITWWFPETGVPPRYHPISWDFPYQKRSILGTSETPAPVASPWQATARATAAAPAAAAPAAAGARPAEPRRRWRPAGLPRASNTLCLMENGDLMVI